MKTITRIIALLTIAASVAFMGCRRADDSAAPSPEPQSLYEYYQALRTPIGGQMLLQSYLGFPGKEWAGSQIITGGFKDRQGNTLPGGKVVLGDITLTHQGKENGYQYGTGSGDPHHARRLFGTDMPFLLEVPIENSAARTDDESEPATVALRDTLYVPQQIGFTYPTSSDDAAYIVKAGYVVKWNADPRNERGVLLALQYSPDDPLNKDIAQQYDKKIEKALSPVRDTEDGYTFVESDIADFPEGANVLLLLSRVNYKMPEHAGNKYLVGAVTLNEMGLWVAHKKQPAFKKAK